MPVNDPKTPKPEDIFNEVFNSFFKNFPTHASGTTTNTNKTTPTAPTVDPVAEANRLLKKAETAASGSVNEADILLAIADRHIRIIDTALAHQR